MELLLIPLHLQTHWCLATIDFTLQRFCYYDSLQAMNSTSLEQNGQVDQFIQSIQLVPDTTIGLFNTTQLNDLDQFCGATSGKASVLGIDVTFNLGTFYVTLCIYQNFRVVNENGKHSIMIGATLIHAFIKKSAEF